MNLSSHNTIAPTSADSELASFYQWSQGFVAWCSWTSSIALVVLYPIGFITSVLTVYVLRNDEQFKSVSFYHQTIALISIIVCFILTGSGIYQTINVHTYDAVIYLNYVGVLASRLGRSIEGLLLFMSLERIVACLWPNYYRTLNTVRISYIVVPIAVGYKMLMGLPYFFAYVVVTVDNGTNFVQQTNHFGSLGWYGTFAKYESFEELGESTLLFIFTITLLISLKRIRLKKVKTLGSKSTDFVKQQKCFTYLLLSQAFPIILWNISSLIWFILKGYMNTKQSDIFSLSYAQGCAQIIINNAYSLFVLLKQLFYQISHMHFFFYIMFSKKFRVSVWKRIRRKNPSVGIIMNELYVFKEE